MGHKKGIGLSPLTNEVFLGKQNKEKGMWIGEKENITDDFLAVACQYFKEDTITGISCSNGEKNLFINVKDNKVGIEKAIKGLNKLLAKAEKNKK